MSNGTVRASAQHRQAPPVVLVIFGASGDLAHRKLVPSLFDLFVAGLLSPFFAVVGFSRSSLSDVDFRATLREGVQRHARHTPIDEQAWTRFSSALHYQSGHFDDPDSYRELAERLAEIDRDTARRATGSSILPRPRSCSPSSSTNSA